MGSKAKKTGCVFTCSDPECNMPTFSEAANCCEHCGKAEHHYSHPSGSFDTTKQSFICSWCSEETGKNLNGHKSCEDVLNLITFDMRRFNAGRLTSEEVESLRLIAVNDKNPDVIQAYKVSSWNLNGPAVGETVMYAKSEEEGAIIVRTISIAYTCGTYGDNDLPMKGFIDLEHIGMALLDKVTYRPDISKRFHTKPLNIWERIFNMILRLPRNNHARYVAPKGL